VCYEAWRQQRFAGAAHEGDSLEDAPPPERQA